MLSLQAALAYENPYLLDRYTRDYGHNRLSAEIALAELIKYLWLCEKHRQDREASPENTELHFECNMYPEMSDIDDIWHTFLLFTQEYQEFCLKYLGRFIHHVPETKFELIEPQSFETELARYFSYIYDHLGEDTLKLWFAEHLDTKV